MVSFRNNDYGLFVNIFCLYVEPAKFACVGLRSTYLMNFATHEALYCLFPKATLERKWMVKPVNGKGCLSDGYRRGFRVASFNQSLELEECRGVRRFGDVHTQRNGYSSRGFSSRNGVHGLSFWLSQNGVHLYQYVE